MGEGADSHVKVVVVGAGAVGSAFAYTLVTSGYAQEIILIDQDRAKAEAEAMDLNHGLCFGPPAEIRAGDYADCQGASVVVVTAGAPQRPRQSRRDLISRNSGIVRAIADEVVRHTQDAVLLVVTNPVDALTYDMIRHTGLPATQVIGSGTVLDSARFRYLLSKHCSVDARNVHAYILGEHGDSEMAAWSMVHVAGIQMDDFCLRCMGCDFRINRARILEQVRTSAYHLIASKGFTNYGVAQALLRIVGAIVRDERSVLTVSSLVRGYGGIDDVCLSVPCVVGRRGILRQLLPDLPDDEREALEASAQALRQVQASLSPDRPTVSAPRAAR